MNIFYSHWKNSSVLDVTQNYLLLVLFSHHIFPLQVKNIVLVHILIRYVVLLQDCISLNDIFKGMMVIFLASFF